VIDVEISACVFTLRVKAKNGVSLAGSVGDFLESYYCIRQMVVLGTFLPSTRTKLICLQDLSGLYNSQLSYQDLFVCRTYKSLGLICLQDLSGIYNTYLPGHICLWGLQCLICFQNLLGLMFYMSLNGIAYKRHIHSINKSLERA